MLQNVRARPTHNAFSHQHKAACAGGADLRQQRLAEGSADATPRSQATAPRTGTKVNLESGSCLQKRSSQKCSVRSSVPRRTHPKAKFPKVLSADVIKKPASPIDQRLLAQSDKEDAGGAPPQPEAPTRPPEALVAVLSGLAGNHQEWSPGPPQA